MAALNDAESQVLIYLAMLAVKNEPADSANLAKRGGYFRRSLLDWTQALPSLTAAGLITYSDQVYHLTANAAPHAALLHADRPSMWYFYNDYYRATRDSKAYAVFCRRVFGRDFAQHGFSDMAQLTALLEVGQLAPDSRVLDLGCGNGAMAEYICEETGACVTGIDYVPEAIQQAQQRARRNPRLAFYLMNMDALTFPPASFDALISIDTLYFVDTEPMVAQMQKLLAPGGQMLIFFAHGADGPGADYAAFPKESLPPDKTPLGVALHHRGLPFRTWDYTRADYEHARLKKHVIEDLRTDLEAEGNAFLYQNRLGEANGVMAAVEAGVQARYLYHVRVP